MMRVKKITSELSQVKVMAQHLHAFCEDNQIGDTHIGILELILVEAINNVIEHAYSNEEGNDIEVGFMLENQEVIMHVTDQGTPVPKHLQDGDGMPDSQQLPEGGWGLALINALADNVTFSSKNGFNTVTLTKQITA